MSDKREDPGERSAASEPRKDPLTAHRSPLTVLIAGGGTGGHLMPALAIAEMIRRRFPGWRVVLVGAERGVEAAILPTRDFPYELLQAEPIYRRQWWKNLRWPFLALRLIRSVDRLLDRERPGLVIGTGGYASAPVVWRAAGRGIPTAILELNADPGLATRWLAGRVREIWLGVPETRSRLRPGKDTVALETGNPILPPDPARAAAARARFGLAPDQQVLLVTGGSQGARAINEAVEGWLETGGAKGVALLWATGKTTYPSFRRWHRPPGVQVLEFIDPMADAYAVATLAVSRGGMMTISELAGWGIPSIIIPLPTAAGDHQTPNAKVLASVGAAIHLPQSELSATRLGRELESLLSSPDRLAQMAAAARSRGRPDAADRIADRIGILSG